jgi:hypothetical protein
MAKPPPLTKRPTFGLARSQGDHPLTAPVPTRRTTRDLPAGWEKDPLTQHWEACASNMVTNFAAGSDELRHMQVVDNLFVEITKNLINSKRPIVALLLLRTHSAYRTATVIAASGMATDTYPTLRSVLETAGYALLMYDAPELETVWLERHTSEAQMAAVKAKFTVGAIKRAVKAKDTALHAVFEKLYETTIDMGGHPNERSLTGSMTLTEDEKQKVFNVEYVQGNSLGAKLAKLTAARVGLCSLYLFQHIMKERFEILGLRDAMQRLRNSGL